MEKNITAALNRYDAIQDRKTIIAAMELEYITDLAEWERRAVEDYHKLLEAESNGLSIGDRVLYRVDDGIVTATVLAVFDRGDIRTDVDGVKCAGEYVKLTA